jgi:hypothetical protein
LTRFCEPSFELHLYCPLNQSGMWPGESQNLVCFKYVMALCLNKHTIYSVGQITKLHYVGRVGQ